MINYFYSFELINYYRTVQKIQVLGMFSGEVKKKRAVNYSTQSNTSVKTLNELRYQRSRDALKIVSAIKVNLRFEVIFNPGLDSKLG